MTNEQLKRQSQPAAVREALEPFAKAAAAAAWPTYEGDTLLINESFGVTVGDLRKARAALRASQPATQAPETRTEICMNEKCPRGQGVPVEIFVGQAPAGTGGDVRAAIAKVVCCPDGCILAACGDDQCVALNPEYTMIKTADAILALSPPQAPDAVREALIAARPFVERAQVSHLGVDSKISAWNKKCDDLLKQIDAALAPPDAVREEK